MLASPESKAFLVRVSDGNFVVAIDGKTISTTSIPSYAHHADYTRCDILVQDLRRRGHRQCVVTNHLGQPVSADDINVAMNSAPKVDPLPANYAEYDAINSRELRARLKDPAFRARIEEILSQPRPVKQRAGERP